jgi:hypothetical protein
MADLFNKKEARRMECSTLTGAEYAARQAEAAAKQAEAAPAPSVQPDPFESWLADTAPAPTDLPTTGELMPAWYESLYTVVGYDKWFDASQRTMLTSQGVNMIYNHIAWKRAGGRPSSKAASDYLMQHELKRLDGMLYAPADDAVFELDGKWYGNEFDCNSFPAMIKPEKWTEHHDQMVETVQQHIAFLCAGSDSDYRAGRRRIDLERTVINFMAHNVQRPGSKIKFALLLISACKQNGKTTLGAVINAALGGKNVSEVAPKDVATNFTGWGAGSLVAIIEEMIVPGKAKAEVYNTLKPYLSNQYIPITAKNANPVTVVNCTNYILTSNRHDCLPIEAHDPRYMVLFVPELRMDGEYYTTLYDAITAPGVMRTWLMNHEISADFDSRVAVDTAEKLTMSNMHGTVESADAALSLSELLAVGGVGFNELIAVPKLLAAASGGQSGKINITGGGMSSAEVTKTLKQMGWLRAVAECRWAPGCDGLISIWVRNPKPIDKDVAIRMLNMTLPADHPARPTAKLAAPTSRLIKSK